MRKLESTEAPLKHSIVQPSLNKRKQSAQQQQGVMDDNLLTAVMSQSKMKTQPARLAASAAVVWCQVVGMPLAELFDNNGAVHNHYAQIVLAVNRSQAPASTTLHHQQPNPSPSTQGHHALHSSFHCPCPL